MKHIARWQVAGFLFTSVLGTFLHFLFELTGGSVPAALVSAVNESIWEHMKLIYYPMLLFALFQYRKIGKGRPDFWCIKLAGFLTGLALIPILYYCYTGILGINASWFNVAIFFLAAGAAFWVETRMFQKEAGCPLSGRLSVALILVFGVLFTVFTFSPPHIPFFRDPVTGTYGFLR